MVSCALGRRLRLLLWLVGFIDSLQMVVCLLGVVEKVAVLAFAKVECIDQEVCPLDSPLLCLEDEFFQYVSLYGAE